MCRPRTVPHAVGGDITFREDAEATLAAIYRSPVQLDPAVITSRRPLPPRTFLARMLNNLKQARRWGRWGGEAGREVLGEWGPGFWWVFQAAQESLRTAPMVPCSQNRVHCPPPPVPWAGVPATRAAL